MAVPGFPRGANPQSGSANLLFGQISPENCLKMKEIGPGRRGPDAPVRSAKGIHININASRNCEGKEKVGAIGKNPTKVVYFWQKFIFVSDADNLQR